MRCIIPELISESEKKKQLLIRIDNAIKNSAFDMVENEDRTETPDEYIWVNQSEALNQQYKKYRNNKEKYGIVIFQVANDCIYTILNVKENLRLFKKVVIKSFPTTKNTKKTSKKSIPRISNKRTQGEDTAYYKPFIKRTQRIKADIRKNYYELGYYTNGSYMVKVDKKPADINFDSIDSEKIQSILDEYSNAVSSKIVAEFTSFSLLFPVCAHVVTQNEQKHFALNTNFVDIILTSHPTAKTKTILSSGMTFFVVKNEIVGLLMPLALIDKDYKLGTLESLGEFAVSEYLINKNKKNDSFGKFKI